MKTPNKKEFQKVAFNPSSDIDSEHFINLYRKCTAKPYYISVNDTTLVSGNPLRFRSNF